MKIPFKLTGTFNAGKGAVESGMLGGPSLILLFLLAGIVLWLLFMTVQHMRHQKIAREERRAKAEVDQAIAELKEAYMVRVEAICAKYQIAPAIRDVNPDIHHRHMTLDIRDLDNDRVLDYLKEMTLLSQETGYQIWPDERNRFQAVEAPEDVVWTFFGGVLLLLSPGNLEAVRAKAASHLDMLEDPKRHWEAMQIYMSHPDWKDLDADGVSERLLDTCIENAKLFNMATAFLSQMGLPAPETT